MNSYQREIRRLLDMRLAKEVFLSSFYARDNLRLVTWGSSCNWVCWLLFYELKPFQQV